MTNYTNGQRVFVKAPWKNNEKIEGIICGRNHEWVFGPMFWVVRFPSIISEEYPYDTIEVPGYMIEPV